MHVLNTQRVQLFTVPFFLDAFSYIGGLFVTISGLFTALFANYNYNSFMKQVLDSESIKSI